MHYNMFSNQRLSEHHVTMLKVHGCVMTLGLSTMLISFLPSSNIFFTVGFVIAERVLYIPR